jgi:DNA-directed RNA polymerase specialized sigma24 family protein
MTARKAADILRHNQREKRGGGLVRGDSALQPAGGETGGAGLDAMAGDEPTPLEADLLAEEVEVLLQKLADLKLRQVAVWKLEGYTNAEIAGQQNCSEKTIERRLTIIRRLLKAT